MSGRNRLATATSPYLLQHADNPVHWWPGATRPLPRQPPATSQSFSPSAMRHATGATSCESFEDSHVAELINEQFVAIKVDQERPVDAVYMQATQAMTGHGGWPRTSLLDSTGGRSPAPTSRRRRDTACRHSCR